MKANTYPDQYLHIRDSASGEEWITPFGPDVPMDLPAMVDDWIAKQYGGEVVRDGEFMPKLDGNLYAQIITDNRSPDSGIVWQAGGFYLKIAE